MIRADKLKDLTALEKTILARYSKGYNYAKVTYLFEDYLPEAIEITKQLLEDSGYSVNEINIHADYNQVGVVLDIFW